MQIINSKSIVIVLAVFALLAFSFSNYKAEETCHIHHTKAFDASFYESPNNPKYEKIFENHPEYISTQFDFPVGKPDAKNYFKAREFGQDKHLGEDWNGVGGGNSDLGDPVYSISSGYVSFAENISSGWGNIVRVVHKFPYHPEHSYVESFYAHLDEIYVKPGDFVQRGQQIGTIGTADGRYSAHLHLELRSFVDMGIGPGYSDDTFGFLAPTKFIQKY